MCEFAYEVAEYGLYHGPVSLPCFKAPMMQDWLDFTRVSSRTNNKTGQTRNAFCPGHCLSLCPLRVYVIVFRARTRQVTLVANVLPRLPRLHFSTLVPPTDRNTHQVQLSGPYFIMYGTTLLWPIAALIRLLARRSSSAEPSYLMQPLPTTNQSKATTGKS